MNINQFEELKLKTTAVLKEIDEFDKGDEDLEWKLGQISDCLYNSKFHAKD